MSKRQWIQTCFAFAAGFCDTATFVGAFGLFSAHVTGNFILFAVTLERGARDIDYLKLFLFLPFLLGVAFVSGASRISSLKSNFEQKLTFLTAAILLVCGFYFALDPVVPNELVDRANVFILLVAFAMGIQSAVGKVATPGTPATTVMTGNTVQVVLDLLSSRASKADRELKMQKAKETVRIILGFALGCVLAAYLVAHVGLWTLVIPSAILFVATYLVALLSLDK